MAGDLSKRYYRIFANSQSVKGTLAASLLYLFPHGEHILDPFGNTGEVAIEAALRACNISPRKYEKHLPVTLIDSSTWVDEESLNKTIHCFDPKLAHVRSAQKNAKLAGVEQQIQFSKLDAEWIDVKFEEGTVDTIITIPRAVTKREPDTTHLKELCYQASFVLKKGGSLIVGCSTEDTAEALIGYAKTYKLVLAEEAVVYSGQRGYHVMRYEL